MVKRYDAYDFEEEGGDYVLYSDYAALESERNRLREDKEAFFRGMEEARKDRKEAQDKADRLREALEEVANWCGRPLNIKCNECWPGHWPHCHELVMIARKVLEE